MYWYWYMLLFMITTYIILQIVLLIYFFVNINKIQRWFNWFYLIFFSYLNAQKLRKHTSYSNITCTTQAHALQKLMMVMFPTFRISFTIYTIIWRHYPYLYGILSNILMCVHSNNIKEIFDFTEKRCRLLLIIKY